MKYARRLHRQHYQQLFDGWRGGVYDAQLELLCASDHLPKQLVHSIGVHAGAIGNAGAKLRTHTTQKPRGGRCGRILGVVREDAAQVLVVVRRPAPGEILSFLGVVLGKRAPQLAQRLNFALIDRDRRLAGDLAHQLVDVVELFQGRPALVVAAPVDMRIEPDRESLGEILDRVRLRVPVGEVDDEVPALGARLVGRGIGRVRISEQDAIALAIVQLVGLVDRVPRFVPKYSPRFGLTRSLHLQHLAALQPHQARVCQIEGDGEPERRRPD